MATELVKDIQSVKDLQAARKVAGGTGVDNTLLSSFKAAFICQIDKLPTLSAEDGTAVNTALLDSPYDKEAIQEIQTALDLKVRSGILHGTKAGKLPSQVIKHVYNYPTAEEWDILLDQKKIHH